MSDGSNSPERDSQRTSNPEEINLEPEPQEQDNDAHMTDTETQAGGEVGNKSEPGNAKTSQNNHKTES